MGGVLSYLCLNEYICVYVGVSDKPIDLTKLNSIETDFYIWLNFLLHESYIFSSIIWKEDI